MEKQLFISRCTEFFNEINYLYGNNLCLSFLDDNEYFSFDPISSSINCNIAYLEDEQFKEWEKHLGEDFFKYLILHEYGHFHFKKIINNFLSLLIKDSYSGKICEYTHGKNSKKLNELIYEIYHSQDHDDLYLGRQKHATGEFMADFFIKETNEKHNLNLDFNKYLIWRREALLKKFNQIESDQNLHIQYDYVYYYHLYKVFSDTKLEEYKTNYNGLMLLSLMYSNFTWLLCIEQLTKTNYNKQEYINFFF